MPKKKNAVRCAPAAFEGPLDLVEYTEPDSPSCLLLGHLVKVREEDGTATIFREHGGEHVVSTSGHWRRILQEFSTIPPGASPSRRRVTTTTVPLNAEDATATTTDFPDVDFYVFTSELPYLFVRKPDLDSKVCSVGFDAAWTEGVLKDIEASVPTDGDGDGDGKPWPEFFAAPATTPVWRVDLSCKTAVPSAAAQLVRAGYIVACVGSPPQTCIRVKSMYLKPTTDSACATAMSTINDAMPGLTAGTDLYTADLQVHRCMLHWSMLAGCRAVQQANAAPEPLKSYLDTLVAVKTHRRETGRVDTFTSVEATLKFNVAAPVTAAQRQQAIAFFYWATLQVNVPEKTRDLLRRALNMYLYFGFVVLRKRAYEFRGKGKKKRGALLALAITDPTPTPTDAVNTLG